MQTSCMSVCLLSLVTICFRTMSPANDSNHILGQEQDPHLSSL